jgi:transposase InsO family protein
LISLGTLSASGLSLLILLLSIRTFNVINDYNREGLSIDVDLSLPARRVIQSLERLIEWRGKPKTIRCDNGPEYISIKGSNASAICE